jgi:hypothetical protein
MRGIGLRQQEADADRERRRRERDQRDAPLGLANPGEQRHQVDGGTFVVFINPADVVVLTANYWSGGGTWIRLRHYRQDDRPLLVGEPIDAVARRLNAASTLKKITATPKRERGRR